MIEPRREISTTPNAQHGAFDYAELEQLALDPDAVIDFSVNSNPFGTPASVREAIAHVPLDRYPDRDSLALRRRLAVVHQCDASQIVVGNGTAELLLLVAFAFLSRGDRALVVNPTFSEYARVAALVGAQVEAYTAPADHSFAVTVADVEQKIAFWRPRAVFICNPNNPTGVIIPTDNIEQLARAHPETLFVVDEAYINFAGMPVQSAHSLNLPNVLVLRSLTKDYALAGLRLGYALGSADAIAALAQARPAWNVNALAQAAGLAVLSNPHYLPDTMTRLHAAKSQLITGLRDLGLSPLPSRVHYFLVPVASATRFRADLLAHGVMVRDCTSFGLPGHIRIATRTAGDNGKLLAAIAQRLEKNPTTP